MITETQLMLVLCSNEESIKDEDTKICIYCNETKPTSEFPRHVHYKDNLDSRCRTCVKKHSQVRSRLHKEAPPKPNVCECCKKPTDKWVLDHDHNTELFRGWLCDACNTGIGKLGDDINGIINALNYLLSRNK